MNTREMLTLAAAAALSGIDEATLVYLIEYGQLNGAKIDGR